MRRHQFSIPALTILLLCSSVAQADVEETHVDVVCDAQANLALVRFATTNNDGTVQYPTLPQVLDHGLSGSSGSDQSDCNLPNGMTVRVRGGRDQAFGYGAGGANPPAFFSLWIDRRRVLSRQTWRPGYEASFDHLPVYDGVLIEPGRMTVCESAEDGAQDCKSQSLNLNEFPIDRVEYGKSSPNQSVGSFVSNAKGVANNRFCHRYLSRMAPDLDAALQGQGSNFDLDWSPQDAAAEGDDGGHPQSDLIELVPGTTRRLMTWGGEDRYFDGDVIVLAPSTMTARDISASYAFKDIETWPKVRTPAGVTLVSGGAAAAIPAGVAALCAPRAATRRRGAVHPCPSDERQCSSQCGIGKASRGRRILYDLRVRSRRGALLMDRPGARKTPQAFRCPRFRARPVEVNVPADRRVTASKERRAEGLRRRIGFPDGRQLLREVCDDEAVAQGHDR